MVADDSLYQNPFRSALGAARPLVGIWGMLNSVSATEGLGWAGFDWLLIDGEHSPAELGDILSHLRAIAATPTVPIVRIAENDTVLFKRTLDIGARTIMVPMVQDAAEAEAAVRAMRYPRAGNRGFAAMHRASRYGHVPGYVHRASEGLFLIGQVETPEALGRVEEIADVDGLDAVFFGPGDLSANLGRLGEPAHAEITALILDGAAKVRALGKATGALAASPDQARAFLSGGLDFVSVASDCALLFGNADRVAGEFTAYARNQRGRG